MKHIYFTPGPSQLYPTVRDHIQTALQDDILSISHRSALFQEIFSNAVSNLKKLLSIPEEYSIFFLSSATEAMERIIENIVEKESFHFVTGAFSDSFHHLSLDLKKNAKEYCIDPRASVDFSTVDIPVTTEIICFTQNETSTGSLIQPYDIKKIKETYPDKLIAVDIVSSAPYVNLDYSYMDCTFFSVQKGFGSPAGLGILIVSPQAIEKSKYLHTKKFLTGSYHSFHKLLTYAQKNQTPETPNVLGIYLLSKVTEDMLKIGIKNIRKQTEDKATILYDFFENHQDYTPFITDKNIRSQTVIVVECKKNNEEVLKKLGEQNIIVGKGYKDYKTKHIRIANFPAHSMEDVKKMIGIL